MVLRRDQGIAQAVVTRVHPSSVILLPVIEQITWFASFFFGISF
jgi:hypothetical protein